MLGSQGSLLDLEGYDDEPAVSSYDGAFGGLVRDPLGRGAWLDVVPGWVSGAELLLQRILAAAPWAAHERWMYDRMVDEPRLSTRGWTDPPDPVRGMAAALSEHYRLDLSAVSANLYRDGRDSVAWHGDTAGRRVATTVVAIVVLGAPRRFLLRPRPDPGVRPAAPARAAAAGPGVTAAPGCAETGLGTDPGTTVAGTRPVVGSVRPRRLAPGHGDLLVMGGTCQRTYEHAVPKCAAAGVRVALMFREPGVF